MDRCDDEVEGGEYIIGVVEGAVVEDVALDAFEDGD